MCQRKSRIRQQCSGGGGGAVCKIASWRSVDPPEDVLREKVRNEMPQ